ncbi:MAG TPA: cobalamin-dependent protein [Acidimicrobiales bacterium]|nr:cobalamin-dependent protein [Acidimicrobiales bacterium]
MTAGPHDGPTSTLTLQEVADRLGVHYMTAYRYVRTGQLAAGRRDGRWAVTAADLAAFEDSRSRAPAAGRRPARPGRGDRGGDGGGGHGAAGRGDRPGASTTGDAVPADDAGRYRDRLLERLLAGDEAGAWQVVESALVARMAADRAHLDLLAPCLREVGERWAQGTLGVDGEHVASAVAARLAARLAPLCARRGRSRGTVVLSGAPGELHGLPITLVTNVLRSRGWDVVELGPNTPSDDLVRAARAADRLRAVGVSVGSAATSDAAAGMLAEMRRNVPGVPLFVGGPGVPDAAVARRLGGDGWAADANQFDALLSTGRPAAHDVTTDVTTDGV